MLNPELIRAEMAALYDNDAGMPGVGLFFDRLHQAIALTEREKTSGALLLIRIGTLDPYADAAAQQRLRQASMQIAFLFQLEIRTSDSVTAIGLNEYALLLPVTDPHEGVASLTARLLARLVAGGSETANLGRLVTSIGGAAFPPRAPVLTLYERASRMLEEAVTAGGGYRLWGAEGPAATEPEPDAGAAASA